MENEYFEIVDGEYEDAVENINNVEEEVNVLERNIIVDNNDTEIYKGSENHLEVFEDSRSMVDICKKPENHLEVFEDSTSTVEVEENELEKNVSRENNEIYKKAENHPEVFDDSRSSVEVEENELEKNVASENNDEDTEDNIVFVQDIEDSSSSDEADDDVIERNLNKLESFCWEDLIENYDLDELEDSLLKIDNLLWSEKWEKENIKKLVAFTENSLKKSGKEDIKNETENEEIVNEVKEDKEVEEVHEDTKIKIRKSLSNLKYDFNDTLEEIESLINYGERYMIDEKVENKLEEKEKNVSEFSAEDKKKLNFFKKIALPKSILKKTKYDYENKLSNEIDFKTPSYTPKINRFSKIPKSVVSPVGMYIKNSPKIPLLQNIATPIKRCQFFLEPNHISPKQFDENKTEITTAKSKLPTLAYKKSPRNIFLEKENDPEIPNNIKKLMKGPVNPEVIKHVGRIKVGKSCTEKKLKNLEDFDQEHNMTLLSTSISNDTENVSLYVSKKVLRSNWLKEKN